MALTITWPTPTNGFVANVFVPKADTTLVSAGPPEIRSLDVNELRGAISLLWASAEGAPYYDPFTHNGEITISGDIFARSVIFRYPLEFEDGQYTLKFLGANHNIADVKVANQVGIIVGNSFGLIRSAGVDTANVQAGMTAQGYTTGRAPLLDNLDALVSSRAAPGAAMTLTAGERLDIVAAILGGALPSGETVQDTLDLLRMVHTNRLEADPGDPGTMILYADDGVTPFKTWNLRDYLGGAVTGVVGSPAYRGAAT